MSDDDDLFAQVPPAVYLYFVLKGTRNMLTARIFLQIFGGTPAAAPAKAQSQVKQEPLPKQGGHLRQEHFQHQGLPSDNLVAPFLALADRAPACLLV